MLESETREEISTFVRAGFYTKEQLLELFCEEMYGPGELDASLVSATIDECVVKLEADKRSWPDVTDCDRLDSAFDAINRRGIIASHNAGYTQSDGYDDFLEAYDEHPNKPSVIGYCFYHAQDVERAVQGDGLFFAFGPVDSSDEAVGGVKVGNVVREELENAGLKVDWDGTFDKRLGVPKFNWQRR